LCIFFIDLLDLSILAIKGLAGLGNGELPPNFDALLLALTTPAIDLIGELGLGGNAPF
jgi:hypothetical protein